MELRVCGSLRATSLANDNKQQYYAQHERQRQAQQNLQSAIALQSQLGMENTLTTNETQNKKHQHSPHLGVRGTRAVAQVQFE